MKKQSSSEIEINVVDESTTPMEVLKFHAVDYHLLESVFFQESTPDEEWMSKIANFIGTNLKQGIIHIFCHFYVITKKSQKSEKSRVFFFQFFSFEVEGVL